MRQLQFCSESFLSPFREQVFHFKRLSFRFIFLSRIVFFFFVIRLGLQKNLEHIVEEREKLKKETHDLRVSKQKKKCNGSPPLGKKDRCKKKTAASSCSIFLSLLLRDVDAFFRSHFIVPSHLQTSCPFARPPPSSSPSLYLSEHPFPIYFPPALSLPLAYLPLLSPPPIYPPISLVSLQCETLSPTIFFPPPPPSNPTTTTKKRIKAQNSNRPSVLVSVRSLSFFPSSSHLLFFPFSMCSARCWAPASYFAPFSSERERNAASTAVCEYLCVCDDSPQHHTSFRFKKERKRLERSEDTGTQTQSEMQIKKKKN